MYRDIVLGLVLLTLGWLFHITTASNQINIPLDGGAFAEQNEGLQNVEIDFCDLPGEKSIHYDIRLNKKHPICLQIKNNSDSQISINLNFVDGTLTHDEWNNNACKLDTQTDIFGDFVSWYDQQIDLDPHSSITHYAYILYPKDSIVRKGETIYGCITYSLSSTIDNTDSFTILVRRAKFITVYIKKAPNNEYLFLIIFIILTTTIGLLYLNRWK